MTASRIAFRSRTLYKLKHPRFVHFAKRKVNFFIATLCLFTFVIGNMVGQHGWFAFWKSVLGQDAYDQIIFTGTVPPLPNVPNYDKWALYGGNLTQHTYREVPKDALIPLPAYDAAELAHKTGQSLVEKIYSTANLGDYNMGNDHGGSHVGVDISTPKGTPVQSIANGVVEKVALLDYGDGHYVVIRHPNVPDSVNPGKTTTVFSTYAHLDGVLVSEGQVVQKGEQIATSGQTGFASGPHLHFQIDLASAPFHPYWPFTSGEATAAHMSFVQAINAGLHQERGELYTVSPMLFVQQYSNFQPAPSIAKALTSVDILALNTASSAPMSEKDRLELIVKQRRAQRLALIQRQAVSSSTTPVAMIPASSSLSAQLTLEAPKPPAVSVSITAEKGPDTPAGSMPLIVGGSSTDIDHLTIEHSGHFDRNWQKIRILAWSSIGELIKSPSFPARVYVSAAFGEIQFRSGGSTIELKSSDFVNGIAAIDVLPRMHKTVVFEIKGAFHVLSEPMTYDGR